MYTIDEIDGFLKQQRRRGRNGTTGETTNEYTIEIDGMKLKLNKTKE